MADTKQPELSLERFEALVEAYGGDIERFPERDRVPAAALVLRSREARRMLEAAHALDVLLASARENASAVELETALLRIPQQYAQRYPTSLVLPFRSRVRASLAAVAAVVLGLLSGLAPGGEAAPGAASEQADIASLPFADELLDELLDDVVGSEGSVE